MAASLSKRVYRIEQSISLLGMMHDRLKYLQPSMRQMIEGMASLEQFQQMEFLLKCRDAMRGGAHFPQAWEQGIKGSISALDAPQAKILLPLGEVLGSTDLESQLSAITHAQLLLENRLEEARLYREKHAKLYQSLGVLGAIALVIVFL